MKKNLVLLGFLFSASLLQAAAVHDPAPKFSLINTHEERRMLNDYKGKVLFVNFWASWCAPCQLELPELNQLAKDYKGKKVKVFVINVDKERSDARKLLAKLGLKAAEFEVLWDTRAKAVSTYNIEAMPSSFIIDSHGIIQFIHSGFHPTDSDAWRKEIDGLLRSTPFRKNG